VRLALTALALIALGGTARADFKEWSITITPSYALAYVDSRAPSGGGGGVEVGFGVTESLTLKASTFLSWHAVDATMTTPSGTMSAFSAMLGINYALDVIRIVPSFDVAVGVLGLRGDAAFGDNATANALVKPSTAFAIQLGFGVDYLITRQISVGAVVRYHALVTDITRIPVYLYVGPRVTFRFGG
jgi:hypothetical protein